MKPVGIPDMELLQIDAVHLQVPQAVLRTANYVFVREDLFYTDARLGRPLLVQRRDLGGDVDSLFRLARNAAHQLFAVAVAIGQRRVDEVDSQIDSAVQGAEGFIVVSTLPQRSSDAPSAIAYVTDGKASLSKRAIFHPAPMIVKEASIKCGADAFVCYQGAQW